MPVAMPFAAATVDRVVDASQVGTAAGNTPPLDVAAPSAHTAVVDIVTRPATALLASAACASFRYASGVAMVAAQTDAILAFLGFDPPAAP